MPSPTVLYAVAAVAIAGLFAWVFFVNKTVTTAWDMSPDERAKLAKTPPPEDPAPADERAAPPPAAEAPAEGAEDPASADDPKEG